MDSSIFLKVSLFHFQSGVLSCFSFMVMDTSPNLDNFCWTTLEKPEWLNEASTNWKGLGPQSAFSFPKEQDNDMTWIFVKPTSLALGILNPLILY